MRISRSASRACRRARSLGGCRRCRASTPIWSPAATPVSIEPGAAWAADASAWRPPPAGAVGAGAADAAQDPVARRGRRAGRRAAHRPGPGDGAGDAAGGLRRCEVLGLRLEDVRVAEWSVFIADGKGGHQRVVPISNTFFAAVGDYLRDERPATSTTDRVFVALKGPTRGRAAVRRRGRRDPAQAPAHRAGLSRATCHQLRHTCLTRLREAGMAIEAVQAQAGHVSIESTRIYLHLTDDWLADEYRRAADADRRRPRRRAARDAGDQPMSAAAAVVAEAWIPRPTSRIATGPQLIARGPADGGHDAPLPDPARRSSRPAASTSPTARCASSPAGSPPTPTSTVVAEITPHPHRGLQGVARRPTRQPRARRWRRTPNANGCG